MIPFIKKQPNVNLEFLVCRLLERASAQNSGGLTENERLEDITGEALPKDELELI